MYKVICENPITSQFHTDDFETEREARTAFKSAVESWRYTRVTVVQMVPKVVASMKDMAHPTPRQQHQLKAID